MQCRGSRYSQALAASQNCGGIPAVAVRGRFGVERVEPKENNREKKRLVSSIKNE